jgi:hypothetical protein
MTHADSPDRHPALPNARDVVVVVAAVALLVVANHHGWVSRQPD